MTKALRTDASAILSQNDAFVANDEGVAFYGLDGTADAILGVLEQKTNRYVNNCADNGRTRETREKNLQNFLLSFAELFLLPQLLDGEGDVGHSLLETIIGLLLKLWGGFLRLIDDPRRLANNSVSKLLLVARDARLELVVIRPVLVAELRVLSQRVMIETPFCRLMRHFPAAGTLERWKNSSSLCLIDAKSLK